MICPKSPKMYIYVLHIETKKNGKQKHPKMRRSSNAHKLWPGRMIKMCRGLARPQLFHLFRLRLAELDPKKQDRPVAIHGWRMLSFDEIFRALEMSQEKPLELPYFACCVCWCLLALWIIFQKKSRDSSQSQIDSEIKTRHRPCATPSASPGSALLVPFLCEEVIETTKKNRNSQ